MITKLHSTSQIILFLQILLVQLVRAQQSVFQVYQSQRYTGNILREAYVNFILECASLCYDIEDCNVVNFKHSDTGYHNCHLIQRDTAVSSVVLDTAWTLWCKIFRNINTVFNV